MSRNANNEPLGSNRKVFGGGSSYSQPPALLQQTKFVDAMGKPIERQIVSGACTKCGFVGHLPFQCRNNMPIEIDGALRKPILSSSDSEGSDFETPLQREDRLEREHKAKRIKKALKKQKKKEVKREAKKHKHHSSSDSDSDSHKKSKKSKHKKEKKSKKSKKHRRHSSSSG